MIKRMVCALLCAVMLLALLCGCGEDKTDVISPCGVSTTDAAIDIDITEAMYVTYINEIYTNHEDYLGKTIRIQGMFTCEDYTSTGGQQYRYVYRTGPGCCGNDGSMCGFEFTCDAYPEENDWIEVIGVLDSYIEEHDGQQITYLTLRAQSVTVLDERGAEIVTQ